MNTTQQELIENFNLFDDWIDKYQFIIDLGKKLDHFPEEFKQDQYKIKACQSNVWMHGKLIDNKIILTAISDSAIVNGLIYLLILVYSDHTPQEILDTKPEFITQIGLDKHLSPTRKNGLYSMLQAIRNMAVENL